MAERQTTGKAGKGTKPADDEERAPTKRTILKRETVIVIPEGTASEKIAEAGKALGIRQGATVEASAFSGGRVHERPPEPKIEGSDFED